MPSVDQSTSRACKKRNHSQVNTEETIHQYFISNNLTLSFAESCTGGNLAAKITKIPGASQFFLGSLVCYANSLKEKILQVPNDIILTKGAVSEETVRAMAKGLITLTDCDVGLAISGLAGPSGGSKEKPIGTIWIAIIKKNQKLQTLQFLAQGNRETIISQSVDRALEELLKFVQN